MAKWLNLESNTTIYRYLARLAEADEQFGFVPAELPQPSDHTRYTRSSYLTATEGIISVANDCDSETIKQYADAILQDTWKVNLSDLKCRLKNGEPFVLGEGLIALPMLDSMLSYSMCTQIKDYKDEFPLLLE